MNTATSKTAKKLLTVTLPDGGMATRTTHHAYTHAIVFLSLSRVDQDAGKTEPTWGICAWTAQPEAALARAKTTLAKWPAKYLVSGIRLVEVNA